MSTKQNFAEASEAAMVEVATIVDSALKLANLVRTEPGTPAAVTALSTLRAARAALE